MSYPSDSTETRGSGLILASSPAAKAYGITNISRARDLPFPIQVIYILLPQGWPIIWKEQRNQFYL